VLLSSLGRGFEPMHAVIPEGSELCPQAIDSLPVRVVEPACSFPPDGNELAFEQHTKMLGNSWSGKREMTRDFSSRALVIPYQGKDPPPRPVSQSSQGRIH
jgi:hypothetical protein